MNQTFGMPLEKRKKENRLAKIALYLVTISFSVFIGQQILRATVTSFTFAEANAQTSGQVYTFGSTIEVNAGSNGLAQLKSLTAGVVDDTASEFDTGATYNNTYWDSGVSRVVITPPNDPPSALSGAQKRPINNGENGLVFVAHLDTTCTALASNPYTDTVSDSLQALSGTETNGSAGGSHLTCAGGSPASSAFNLYRSFDGGTAANSPKIDFGDNFDYGGAQAFSVGAWVNFNSTAAVKIIIGRWRNVATQHRQWYFGANASNPPNLILQTGNGTTSSDANTASTGTVSTGAWHFVMATTSGGDGTSTVKYYIDGKLDSTTTNQQAPTTGVANQLVVGAGIGSATAPGGTNTMNGDLDEVMLFSRVLSELEVANLYTGTRKNTFGLFHFENNATDSSGFSFTGTWTGTAAYAGGKIGSGSTGAANLDGSAKYVTFPAATNVLLNATSELTLEAWIYAANVSGTKYILSSTTNAGSMEKYGLRLNGANLEARSQGTTPQTFTGKKTIAATTWTHVAATWHKATGATNGYLTLYVNGVPDVIVPITAGSITSGNTQVRIGADYTPATYYNGRIDEAAVSLRAKSSAEILESAYGYLLAADYISADKTVSPAKPWNKIDWTGTLAYGPFLGTESGMTHLYHLDDASGASTATDSISSGAITADITVTTNAKVTSGIFKTARYINAAGDYIRGQSSLGSMTAFSFEAWVAFKTATAGGATQYIFDIGTQDPSLRRNNSDQLEILEANTVRVTSSRKIQDTGWHHYGVTYDGGGGGTMKLYIDGVLDNSAALASASSTAAALNIGDDGAGGDTFLGAIDEFSMYNTDQSANVANHYDMGRYQIRFLTRSCNGTCSTSDDFHGPDTTVNSGKNNLEPITSAPASTTKVGLWHFNELSWDGTLAEVDDVTSNGNDGTSIGATASSDAFFIKAGTTNLGRSALFNGMSDAIVVPDSSSLRVTVGTAGLSVEAWIKMDQAQEDGATIVSKLCRVDAGNDCNNSVIADSYALIISSTQKLKFYMSSTTAENISSNTGTVDGVVPIGEWTHVVAAIPTGANSVKFYVNGVNVYSPSISATTIKYNDGPLFIGKSGTSLRPGFRGLIDDLAIYSTDIATGNNISDQYNRGNPFNVITAASTNPQVGTNTNFQYKAFFRGEGTNSPKLASVSLRNSTYESSDPTIENVAANAIAYTSSVDSFAPTETLNGGAIGYIFKCSGANCTNNGAWRYYNGSNWVSSNGTYAQSASATTLNDSVMTTYKPAEGYGSLYWKAFLRTTTGEQQVQLSNIDITIDNENMTAIAPNSGTYYVGETTLDVNWDAFGSWVTGGTVKVQWRKTTSDSFTDLGTAPADQATGGCTATGHAGCKRFVVPDGISDTFQLKVLDNADGTPNFTGSAAITVKGKIVYATPDGSLAWLAESTKYSDNSNAQVGWAYYGTIGNVTIAYDHDANFSPTDNSDITSGGVAANAATGCTPPTTPVGATGYGCYVWSAGPSTTYLVAGAKYRMAGAVTPNANWDSPAFEVRGWYQITTPSASGTWKVGATDKQFVFDVHGVDIGGSGDNLVMIQYSTDTPTFATWTTLPGFSGSGVSATNGTSRSWAWNPVQYIDCTNPDAGCTTVRYRVKSKNSATLIADQPGNVGSEFNMTVLPDLTLSVAGSPALQSGAGRAVSWSLVGDSSLGSTVDVFWSTDSFGSGSCTNSTQGLGTCNVCIDQTASSGTCSSNWTIPSFMTTNAKLKIVSDADNNITYTTGTNTIHAKFAISAPTASSIQFAEENLTLSWDETTPVSPSGVDIWYRIGSGAWTKLNSSALTAEVESGSYNGLGANDNGPWTIKYDATTFIIHDDVQLRVVDTNDTNFYSAGTVSFKSVMKPRLLSPLGNSDPAATDQWKVGTKYIIDWAFKGDTSPVSQVKINYCADGSITCGLPVTIATVSATNDPGGPGAGVCDPQSVSAPESAGCYQWNDGTSTGVADNKTKVAKIFITDAETTCYPVACTTSRSTIDPSTNPAIGSTNNIMLLPKLAFHSLVPAPVGVQVDADVDENVRWDSQGTPLTTVKLTYDDGSANFSNTINSSATNTSAATPPSSPNNTSDASASNKFWHTPSTSSGISTSSQKYKIRIEDTDTNYNAYVRAESGNYDVVAWFNTYKDGSDVTLSGQDWRAGTNQTIKWTSHPSDVATVKLQYTHGAVSPGGTWYDIIQSSPTQGETSTTGAGAFTNSGTFIWKVARNSSDTTDYIRSDVKVRVVDVVSGHIQRTSPIESSTFKALANFSVAYPPNGSEVWRETQDRIIRWKTKVPVPSTVTLQYSTDDDANASSFDSPQSIATGITNGANSGCSLLAGSYPGGVGADETEGCYKWSIPSSLIDDTVYVRVKDANGSHPDSTAVTGNGVSSVFSIKGIEAVTAASTAPYVESALIPGKYMDVFWSGTGLMSSDTNKAVKIFWTIDDNSFSQIGTTYDANSATNSCTVGGNLGCARVLVPDYITGSGVPNAVFKVRVEDSTDAEIKFLSIGYNTLGKVEFSPNPGGGTYTVNNTFDVKWISFGTINGASDTKVELDTAESTNSFNSGGASYTGFTGLSNNTNSSGCAVPDTSGAASQYPGCYRFTLPDRLSNSDAKVKVSDGAALVQTITSTTFITTGAMVLRNPAASDVWKVETTKKIDGTTDISIGWTYTSANLGNVAIEFDRDGDFSGGDTGSDLHRQIASGIAANASTSCTAPSYSAPEMGAGCYQWTATADDLSAGASAKFRVTAATPNPDVVTVLGSTPAFEVRGWYVITTPSSIWLTGETNRAIQWETHGNGMGNIDLEYKLDAGGWTAVSGGTNKVDSDNDTNSYTWPAVVDSRASGACATSGVTLGCDKVRLHVKQTGGGTIESQSNLFTIKPRVLVTTPTGGNLAFLIGATSRTVDWTLDGTVSGTVDIYYSTDSQWGNSCTSSTGAGKCSACSAAASALTCTWNPIPNTPSLTVKLRAEANSDTTLNTVTTTNARIHGKFTANLPACAGTDCFSEDTISSIAWSQTAGTSGTIPNVRIEYSSNDGGAWLPVVNSTANDTSYDSGDSGGPWRVPENVATDRFRLRVYDANDSALDSAGETSNFSVKTKLRLLSPQTGIMPVAASLDIRWAYQGTLTNMDVKLCSDGTITCSSPISIATVGAGSATGGCTAPSGGELGTYETGGCYKWTVSDARDTDDRVILVDGDSSCTPNACTSARPKVNNGSTSDIKVTENVVMTLPNTAIQVDAGSVYQIQFTARGTMPSSQEKVQLWYASNGDAGTPTYSGAITGGNPYTLSPVPDNTVRTYSHNWTVPSTISTSGVKYRVQVKDNDTSNYAEALDNSDASFDIVAKFDTFKDGSDVDLNGQSWKVLTNQTIKWTTAGTVTNVKLQYSNGAIGWTDIVQSSPTQGETTTNGSGVVSNSGSFIWKVPNVANILRSDTKVQVIDADSGHILRTTPVASNTFKVLANLTAIYPPNNSEVWRDTQTRIIRWKAKGNNATLSTVTLEYSTNGDADANTFDSPQLIKTAAAHGTNTDNGGCSLQGGLASDETEGCFAWSIPTLTDDSVYVRVKDADAGHADSTVASGNGVSSVFSVKAIEAVTAVTTAVVSPETARIPGKSMDVQWTGTGLLATDTSKAVKIFWTTNGSTFSQIGTTYDADSATGGCTASGTGCARVTLPDGTISTTLQIRVEDSTDAEIKLLSSNYTAVGKVEFLPDPGGSSYTVNNNFDVKWISFGTMDGASDTKVELDTSAASNAFNSGGGSYTAYSGLANSSNSSGCTPPDTAGAASQYAGCYRFTMPDRLSAGADAKVKVTDGTTNAQNVTSTAFTTTGSLVLRKPSGSDVWKVETQTDINGTAIYIGWTYTSANLGNVAIEFDRDGDFSGGDTGGDLHRTIASGNAPNSAT